MRDLLATIVKCLRRRLGWPQPTSKQSLQTLDVFEEKQLSPSGTDCVYRILDIPPQVPDLEWVTTTDLAVEMLRRVDVAVLTFGRQKSGKSYVLEVYTKGSLVHKLTLMKQTREFLLKVGADEE